MHSDGRTSSWRPWSAPFPSHPQTFQANIAYRWNPQTSASWFEIDEDALPHSVRPRRKHGTHPSPAPFYHPHENALPLPAGRYPYPSAPPPVPDYHDAQIPQTSDYTPYTPRSRHLWKMSVPACYSEEMKSTASIDSPDLLPPALNYSVLFLFR